MSDPERLESKRILTTPAHRGFTLAGTGFVFFEILFLVFYSDRFWFSWDLVGWGVPAALLMAGVAHFFLWAAESPAGCRYFGLIWKGSPPMVYWRWITLEEPLGASGMNAFPEAQAKAIEKEAETSEGTEKQDAESSEDKAEPDNVEALEPITPLPAPYKGNAAITFGNRRVLLTAIDELALTFWGNLHIRSYSLTGKREKLGKSGQPGKTAPPELVFKIPFSVVDQPKQKLLIETIQKYRPDVVLNKRLTKRLDSNELPAASSIQLFGAAFLFWVLMDVGHSTFTYLEMLKGYHLAQFIIRHPEDLELTKTVAPLNEKEAKAEAQKCFDRAEDLRTHPLPWSWVTNELLSKGSVAAGAQEARSEALWFLGNKEESIKAVEEALKFSPKSFRYNLRMARLFYDLGKLPEARSQIRQAIDSHRDSLLPRLYMVALLEATKDQPKAHRFYEIYAEELDYEVFGTEPHWPPGGNTFVHDIWYKDDLEFVLNKLVR